MGVGSENFFGLYVYRLTTFFSKFCSILILSCSLSLWWSGGCGFLVITVSQPTFCCVGVGIGVVVEVGVGL